MRTSPTTSRSTGSPPVTATTEPKTEKKAPPKRATKTTTGGITKAN